MIGTTDKTVFTRLAEVLRKRIITMVATLGSFQKNKMDRKFGFSIMCQEFPVYLSLITGYVVCHAPHSCKAYIHRNLSGHNKASSDKHKDE